MKKTFASLSLIAFMMPFAAAASQLQFDAALTQGSVSFYPSQFYVGETVRIYTNIINLGTQDMTGGVSFFQGAGALAAPTPFSLKANGANEDVWIDWVPTEGTYNIMVKVETQATDQNLVNNIFVTPMMTVQKRPPPPPPLVQQASTQGSLPVSLPNVAKAQAPALATQTVPASQKKALTSAAEQIVKKLSSTADALSPRAPLPIQDTKRQAKTSSNPALSKTSEPVTQKAEINSQTKQPASPSITPEVKGTKVTFQEPERYTQKGTTQWSDSQKDLFRKINDPAKTGIAVAVFVTLIFLAAGFYFLKVSKQ